MWHVTMYVYMDVCVYVHVHVFMLYLDVLAYESMCVKARGQGQVFSSVASLLGFLRQSLLLRLELTDLGR